MLKKFIKTWSLFIQRRRKSLSSITILLKDDSQVFIVLTYNIVFYSITKYINIQYHYIYNEIIAKKVKLLYIPTKQIIADNLTKALKYS